MRIEVKVQPKSSQEKIVHQDGVVKAYVRVAPEAGKANAAVIALLAKHYKVRKSAITIIQGKQSRHKVIDVEM